MADDVALGDATGGSSAGNLREIDVVLLCNLANQRRGAWVVAYRCSGCRSCHRRGSGGCRSRCSSGRGRSSFAGCAADDGDYGVDGDGLAFADLDLGEGSGDGRGDLGVDLVGRDLEDGLVTLDGVADLLEPFGDRALGDGLAHLRHHDLCTGTCGGDGGGGSIDGSRGGGACCGSGRGGGCGLSLGWRGGWSRRGGAFFDGADNSIDLDSGAFGDLDVLQDSGGRRGDLGVDLIG